MNLRNMLRLRIFPKIRKSSESSESSTFSYFTGKQTFTNIMAKLSFWISCKKIVNSQNSLLFSSKFQIHNFQFFLKITGFARIPAQTPGLG